MLSQQNQAAPSQHWVPALKMSTESHFKEPEAYLFIAQLTKVWGGKWVVQASTGIELLLTANTFHPQTSPEALQVGRQLPFPALFGSPLGNGSVQQGACQRHCRHSLRRCQAVLQLH